MDGAVTEGVGCGLAVYGTARRLLFRPPPPPPSRANGSAEFEQRFGPLAGSVGAGVKAGIGVNFSAGAGMEDGKLSANVDLGAALLRYLT